MNGYMVFGFVVYAAAVIFACFSSDPVVDIHAYMAAAVLLLLIIILQLSDIYKVLRHQ